jgi:hypothetical protein
MKIHAKTRKNFGTTEMLLCNVYLYSIKLSMCTVYIVLYRNYSVICKAMQKSVPKSSAGFVVSIRGEGKIQDKGSFSN